MHRHYFRLGDTTVTWTVTDWNGNSASAAQLVTVADTAPPMVTAALDSYGTGDDWGDDDEGLFVVRFSADDGCDSMPNVSAVLLVQGRRSPIPVNNGQLIEFECDDENADVEWEDGILEIEAPGITLEVTATDASSNAAAAEALPAGLGAETMNSGKMTTDREGNPNALVDRHSL